MPTVKIKDKDYGFQRIEIDMKELRKRSVKIGIMGNEEVDGISVVDYGMYNEFGTSRIPARPFMSKTAELHTEETTKFVHFLVGRIIDGKISDDTALHNVGMKYQSFVQQTIRDAKNWAVPNDPKTVARKGSTSPLIDTGRLVGSIRYEVT